MLTHIKHIKIIKAVASFLLVVMFTTSCGKVSTQSQENTKAFSLNPNNEHAQTFNEELGAITDEKSAANSLDSLFNYMGTRFAEPSTETMKLMHSNSDKGAEIPTSNTDLLKSALNLQLMAAQEFSARNTAKKGLKVQEDSNLNLISPTELAEQINSKSSDLKTTSDEIRALQSDIRKALPNLAANPDDERMAPIECAVVTWVFMTGDDGTAPEGSMEPLSPEAIQAINDLKSTKGMNLQGLFIVIVVLIVVAVVCGVHDTIANQVGKDIFGNKIHEDEEIKLCVKRKKGKKTYTETKTETKHYDYYTYQDLDKFLADISAYIECDTTKPGDALASLPSKPNTGGNISVAAFQPAASTLEKDGYQLWWEPLANAGKLKKGDIYFLRGDDTKHKLIAKISSWTHSGIIYNPNPFEPRAFESTLYGVDLYNPKTDWHPMVSWSVKRVKTLSETQITSCVDTAVKKWAGKMRYFPEWRKVDYSLPLWLKTWCDKSDYNSMFCFKTVYNTFLLAGINLDSNHTRISSNVPSSMSGYYASDKDDSGTTVARAFIGVTGDDIYYSKHLGQDMFSYGLENLSKPLLTQ